MNFLRNEKKSLSIEITPLIDIVFLLVIFFVVTSKVGDSQFLELDLPETESFEYNLVKEGHEITILESGIVLINNQSFILKWKIKNNSITNIPIKIKNELKTVCKTPQRTILIEIKTFVDDTVVGTFDCRI